MDLINNKSFCAKYLSQFPSIRKETISTLCSNGFDGYYQLLGLNIDSDLPFISSISLGQKALVRKALVQLNNNSNYGFDDETNSFSHNDISHKSDGFSHIAINCGFQHNNTNNQLNSFSPNLVNDESIQSIHDNTNEDHDKQIPIALTCLDNETDDDCHYEKLNRLRSDQFINQKENNYLNCDNSVEQDSSFSSDVINGYEANQEFMARSHLYDEQIEDSNELKTNINTNVKRRSRRKSKELIPLSLIKSRQMPDRDYYKLLKTVRMPYVLIDRLNIDKEVLRNKLLFNESKNRVRRRLKRSKTESEFKDNLLGYRARGPFRCDYPNCGYSGSNAHYLRMHKYRHTGEKHITCQWPGCQFSSIWRHSVREHYYTHTNEKPHKCGWNGCLYSSAQSGNLAKHRRIHTGVKPYLCHWLGCNAKFSNKASLNNHFRYKHNYIVDEDSDQTISQFTDESINKIFNESNDETISETIDESNSFVIKKRTDKQVKKKINEVKEKEVNAQHNIEINGENNTLSQITGHVLIEEKRNNFQRISENSGNQLINNLNIDNKNKKPVTKTKDKAKERRGRSRKSSQTVNKPDLSISDSITTIMSDCSKQETNKISSEFSENSVKIQSDNQNRNSCKYNRLRTDCHLKSGDSVPLPKHLQSDSSIERNRVEKPKPESVCAWPGCHYKTKYKRLLADHQNAHKGLRPHQCKHCDYNSSYFGDIRRHMSKKHSLIVEEFKKSKKSKLNEPKIKTKNCKKKINQLTDQTISQVITQKEESVSCEPKLQTCESIPYLATDQTEVSLNCESKISSDAVKPYFCGSSGCAFFTTDSELFVRHRREHTGEKQYHCDQQQCYYETSKYSSLILHKKRYHRIETNFETSFETTEDNNSQKRAVHYNYYEFESNNNSLFFTSDNYFNHNYFTQYNFL